MSEKKQAEEPTMEEILASIRRIISEEGEPAKDDASPAPRQAEAAVDDDVLELTEVAEDDEEAARNAAAEGSRLDESGMNETEMDETALDEAFMDDGADGVEMTEDDPMADLDEQFSESAADEASAGAEQAEAAGNEAPAAGWLDAEIDPEALLTDIVDPADEREAVMSGSESERVRDTFGQLSDLLVAGYAGADKTLEGMVREMLRPMLKTWLDKNLPTIVERAVAREIARLSRVKRP